MQVSNFWYALLVSRDGAIKLVTLDKGERPPVIRMALPPDFGPVDFNRASLQELENVPTSALRGRERSYELTGGPLRLVRNSAWVFVYEEIPDR